MAAVISCAWLWSIWVRAAFKAWLWASASLHCRGRLLPGDRARREHRARQHASHPMRQLVE